MMRQRRRGYSYFYFPKSSVPWEKTLGDNSKFLGTKFWALSLLRRPGERRYEGVNIITLQHYYIKVCVRDRDMEERDRQIDRHIHRHRCEHPQRSEQGVRSPRAGVTGSHETFGRWELESSRLAGSTQLLSQALKSLLLEQLELFIIQNYSLHLKKPHI